MSEKEILVVDDDESIRKMFRDSFTRKGYVVRLAGSAEEALEILKDRQFHVMFFDLKLPVMSGIDLCREAKEKYPSAFIFAITAYASIFELSDCLDAGFNDYFTKPVSLEALFTVAKDAFEKVASHEMTSHSDKR